MNDLPKFVDQEYMEGMKINVTNFSYYPSGDMTDSFSHIASEASLVLTHSGKEGLVGTLEVAQLHPRPYQSIYTEAVDRFHELMKRNAGKFNMPITCAQNYLFNGKISFYSDRDYPHWSLHCDLSTSPPKPIDHMASFDPII